MTKDDMNYSEAVSYLDSYINYEKLPDELQAELPLKRVWTLVLEG